MDADAVINLFNLYELNSYLNGMVCFLFGIVPILYFEWANL